MADNTYRLFYKEYFKKENQSVNGIKNINKKILDIKIEEIKPINNTVFEYSFYAVTSYPGLLIGSGYGHDYKNGNDEQKNEAYKIGFHFDYNTGMPVIPGSSVKGMLRSCFPQHCDSTKTKKLDQEYKKSRRDFITKILKENFKLEENVDVDKLEDEIFNGVVDKKMLPLYERDIFFDAVPCQVLNEKNQLFDNDYITPHFENPLKNPKPLKFLKVSPNVKYRFEFDLKDSKYQPLITKSIKIKLFEYLIKLLGIGAKTNVGYGQFESVSNNNATKVGKINEGVTVASIKIGDELEANIIDLTNGVTIDLKIKDISFKPRLTGVSPIGLSINQTIKVKVDQIGKQMKFSILK